MRVRAEGIIPFVLIAVKWPPFKRGGHLMANVANHLINKFFSKKAQRQIETLLGNASSWCPEQQAEMKHLAKEITSEQKRTEQRIRNINRRFKSMTITIR